MLSALVVSGILFGINKFKKNEDKYLKFVMNFNSTAKIKIGEKEYECEVYHTDKNFTKIKILKPKTIEGLTFLWKDGVQTASFKNVSKNFDKLSVPEDSFLNLTVKILDSLKELSLIKLKNEDQNVSYKGKIDKFDFDITFSKDGLLKMIDIPSRQVKIIFDCKPL